MHKKVDYPANTHQVSDWIPGINLLTFKMCQGAYPTPEMLKEELSVIRDPSHNDWMINNMIVQGNKIELIDYNDPTHNPGGPGGGNNALIDELYINHSRLMDLNDPVKIEHYFWNYLIRIPIKNRSRNRFINALMQKDDLVFDIGAASGINSQVYVSNHAKVISVEPDVVSMDVLHRLFDYNQQIVLVPKKVTVNSDNNANETTIKELIETYGVPDYCAFNNSDSEQILLHLTIPFKAISFPFVATNMHALKIAVQHLMSLGYCYFNFSCRDIPLYMSIPWESGEIIINKINECIQKDHEGTGLHGFVYARVQNIPA